MSMKIFVFRIIWKQKCYHIVSGRFSESTLNVSDNWITLNKIVRLLFSYPCENSYILIILSEHRICVMSAILVTWRKSLFALKYAVFANSYLTLLKQQPIKKCLWLKTLYGGALRVTIFTIMNHQNFNEFNWMEVSIRAISHIHWKRTDSETELLSFRFW